MTVDKLADLINSVGFPIVACGALFWLILRIMKQNRETMDTLQKALDENTDAVRKLYNRLDK